MNTTRMQMIQDSKLLDPRATIVWLGAALAVALLVPLSVPALLALNIYLFALLGISPDGSGALGRVVRRLLVLCALVITFNGVAVRGGEPALQVMGWTLFSQVGLRNGLYFALRLSAMIVGLAALLAHTPPAAMARGVSALLSPFSEKLAHRLAFYGFMTAGFVPLFIDEFERIRVAQSFRGGTLRGGMRDRAASARMILIPLILSCIHRSEQLAAVVELRGLKDRIGRARTSRGLGGSDVVFMLLTLVVLVSAVLVSGN